MAQKQIEIVIKATDLSAKELDAARQRLAGIGTEAARVKPGMDGAAAGTKGFAGALGPLMGLMSVTAVVGFGKEILDDADALVKLSDKTGIAIEPLQRLKYAAEQSGNTFEQVTSAVSMMQKRLAEGDKSAAGAMRQLGIDTEAFLQLSPDQQFMAIAQEVAKIEDPMQRVKVATDLFGRAGADVLPTLIADVQKLGEEAPIMSEKATKAFDDIGDTISRTWQRAKNATGEGVGTMIDSFSRLFDAAEKLKQGNLNGVADAIFDLEQGALPAAVGVRGLAVGLTSVALSADEADRIGKELTESTKKSIEVNSRAAKAAKDTADAQKKWNAEIKEASEGMYWLTSSGSGLTALIPLVEESGRAMLEAARAANEYEAGLLKVSKSYADLILTVPTVTKTFADVGAAAEGQLGPLDSFFNAVKTGASGLIDGLTGGKGLSGFFANIGTGITNELGAILTGGLNSLMAKAAGIALKGLKEIGGYFKDLFSGPSAEELAGREVVKNFETNVASMLNERQRLEAGNDSWKQTVVMVRDAYLALGKSEAEALADVQRLWESSKGGADDVAAAMTPIQAALDEVRRMAEESGKSFDELRAEGMGAAAGIAGAFDAVRPPWDDWTVPSWGDGLTLDAGPKDGLPGHAAGGVFTRPHAAWIAEGGEAEMVGSRRFMADVLADALRAAARGTASSVSAAPSAGGTIRIYLDGRELTGSVARHLPDVLAFQGVR
jgi:hypothetical protein